MSREPFDVDRIIALLGHAIIQEVDALVINIGTRLPKATPYDTGHARRNWSLGVGAPETRELPGVDIETTNTVTNMVTKLKVSQNRNPFTPIFLSNNVPYIRPLNEGHSPQAAAGFIEFQIEAAVRQRESGRRITL